jgi:hypothetical protein
VRARRPRVHESVLTPATPSIAQLLADARTAHDQYRAHSPHMANVGATVLAMPGDPAIARDALDRAATLRKQAHDADPGYTDSAWGSDAHVAAGIHTDLMTFYAEQLAR